MGRMAKNKDATEKEALLKILDAVGLGLRCAELALSPNANANTERKDEDDDVEIVDADSVLSVQNANVNAQRLLALHLRVLTNITNGRAVNLRPETLRSLFALLAHFHRIAGSLDALRTQMQSESESTHSKQSHALYVLLLGVLINCVERNKQFRASLATHSVRGVDILSFLVRALRDSRRVVAEIEQFKEAEAETDSEEESTEDASLMRIYIEYKVRSHFISLLLGFALQITAQFKRVAAEMGQLDLL